MKELPHTRSCFVCGEFNPSGLRLRFETDGALVRCRFVPGREHVGFRETIHGGLIATLLDEMMVWACAVQSRRFAFCAELNVRFLKPARPGVPLLATAKLRENRKNRIFDAEGELRQEDGTLLAASIGKYMPLPNTDAAEMASDFVGDYRWVFEPAPPLT